MPSAARCRKPSSCARARHVRFAGRQPAVQPIEVEARLRHRRAGGVRDGRRQRQQLQALLADLRGGTEQTARVPVQRLGRVAQRAAHGAPQVDGVRTQRGDPVGARRGRQFGRRRRRGRAYVGGEIADREIRLVTHAGNHRHAAIGHRVGHRFLVKRPQILDAAATPAHDQHVAFGPLRGGGDGRRDAVAGALALHRRRVNHHAHMGRAAAQGGEHVAQGGRLRAGDDADGAREHGHGALAVLVEQAGRGQLFLQPQERFEQGADAGAPDRLDVDLVVAARAIQRDERAHLDLVAFARNEAGILGAAAKHHGAHLGRVVLEREIPVAGAGAREIRYFAGDPAERERAFQQARDGLVEGGHRHYGLGGGGFVAVLGVHGDGENESCPHCCAEVMLMSYITVNGKSFI
jgi:hypothetical protein